PDRVHDHQHGDERRGEQRRVEGDVGHRDVQATTAGEEAAGPRARSASRRRLAPCEDTDGAAVRLGADGAACRTVGARARKGAWARRRRASAENAENTTVWGSRFPPWTSVARRSPSWRMTSRAVGSPLGSWWRP